MKLLGDKGWNVVLCGARERFGRGFGGVNILPTLHISPDNADAAGLRISCGWLVFYFWLDVAWWKWYGRLSGEARERRQGMNTTKKPLNQLIAEMEEKAAAEQRQEIEREARADEARKCAADVCQHCANGEALIFESGNDASEMFNWWHFSKTRLCKAARIHERLHLQNTQK